MPRLVLIAPGGRESLSAELLPDDAVLLIVQKSSIEDTNRMEAVSHKYRDLLHDLSIVRWGHCNLHGEIPALMLRQSNSIRLCFQGKPLSGQRSAVAIHCSSSTSSRTIEWTQGHARACCAALIYVL